MSQPIVFRKTFGIAKLDDEMRVLQEELTAVSISSALNAQCWADITGRDPAKIILKKQNFRD
jgi:hypothetical protein